MPTFKNNTGHSVEHTCWLQKPDGEAKRVLIRFEAGEERALDFWLPWRRLGLTKTSELPRVPDMILISENCEMAAGETRKFQVEYCDSYLINVTVATGKLELSTGEGTRPALIWQDGDTHFHYHAIYDWERAPEITITALEDTKCSIHAEQARQLTINN